MTYLVDRRLNGKNKSAVNRQRFLDRHREQIRDSVQENLRHRSIADTKSGEKVSIPTRDTREPIFHHGNGGRFTHILPGNREFTAGDRISRPGGGGGGGAGAGDAVADGEGLDDFVFEISQREFLDILFEDMALPNLTKRQLSGVEEFQMRRAGFSVAGNPANMDVARSMRAASARRIALTAGKRRRIAEMEQELEALQDNDDPVSRNLCLELERRIAELRRRVLAIPFLDDFDIRYRRHEKVPQPQSQAVMFCLMDVSGSMDQETKDLAKRFFLLLYLFLSRNYDRIDVVFIRHHTSAKEVNEEEFFYSRETGGTVVSSALQLMQDIMQERYPPSQWNVYGAQASDGDNWPEDSQNCIALMHKLLPQTQYYAYIEITDQGERPLWQTYKPLGAAFPKHFAMQSIATAADIYPVFHELFRKQHL